MTGYLAHAAASRHPDVPLVAGKLMAVLSLALSWHSKAVAEDRYALVIGNSNYQRSAPLRNPANDVRDMADRLQSLKFVLIGGGAQLNVKHDQTDG